MPQSKQIVGLDGLRFLTAIMVLIFHLGFWNWTKADNYWAAFPTAYMGFRPFAWCGSVGVEVFFVLSGLVIPYSAQRTSALLFLQHRLVRLLPTAAICSSITATIFLASGKTIAAQKLALLWLKSVTFFPVGPWIDNAYWTLSVEIAFYGLIVTLLFLRRSHWMPAVMACVGGLSSAFWLLASLPERWQVSVLLHPVISGLETHMTLNMLLVRHGCFFAIGLYLWLCLCAEGGKGWTASRIVVIAVCIGGGILQIVFRTGDLARISGSQNSPLRPITAWLGALLFIVAAVRKNDAIHSVLGAAGVSLLRRLSRMTYPLSLLHQAIGVQLIGLFCKHLTAMHSWILAVSIVLGLAYVVSTKAEPALQGALRQYLKPRDRVPVAV